LEIPGSTYLNTAFEYSRSHLWRNFGVVIAFGVLYILITGVATEFFDFTSGGGGALEFKKSKAEKQKVNAATAPTDVEKGIQEPSSVSSGTSETINGGNEDEALQEISGSDSVFTWQDVSYEVPYMGGQRQLLNKVSGYAKPGISTYSSFREN